MATSLPEYTPEELHELLSGLMPEIPGYRVLRLLGRGGMSYVYLGVQESLDRQVAIKVIQPEALRDEISKLRFEREAQIIAKLQHPCIVGIYEIGRTEHGLLYYVLPYLARGHLGQRDLRGDQRGVIEVLRALLWALDYAHGRGVVHRDVKAENVLFDNADRPLLTDFGIALSRRDRSRVTGRGLAVGSGAHMAPEQARGESVDGRADLYSLGILTWEMLTGFLPYKNSDPLGLALMHAVDPVPPLPAELGHWQSFINHSLSKLPKDRFADAREMMVALDEVEATIHRLGLPEAPGAEKRQSWHALGVWARAARERAPLVVPAAAAVALPPQAKPAAVSSTTIIGQRDAFSKLKARLAARRGQLERIWRSLGLRRRLILAGVLLSLPLAALLWRGLVGAPDDPETAPASPPIFMTPASSVPATELAAAPPPSGAAGGLDSSVLQADSGPEPLPEDSLSSDEPVDPLADLPADQRVLAFAEMQIERRRLSQPPGDNAYESLLAAEALSADPQRLAELGAAWLVAATPYIASAIAEQRDDAAQLLLERGRELVGRLALQEAPAALALRDALSAPLNMTLDRLAAAGDLAGLRTHKSRIRALGLPSAWFEPGWSRKLVLAQAGDALPGQPGWRLLRLPGKDQPGLAMQASLVSRSAYAEFARASGREAANCRIRTAMMTLRKRSWQEPGFAQAGDHPVVCVSRADALAFAAWEGQRQGRPVTLPSSADWQRHAAQAGSRCAGKASDCVIEGTLAASAGSASALGIRGSHGNVREWLADGDAARGASWRDLAEQDNPRRNAEADPQRGYDDVGFRLVRPVQRAELEVAVE